LPSDNIKTGTKQQSSSENVQLELQNEEKERVNKIESIQKALNANSHELNNQRAHLAKALIEIGDLKTALKLIDYLPQWFLAADVDLCMRICQSLDKNIIDTIYKKYSSLSAYLKEKYKNSNSSSVLLASKANPSKKPAIDELSMLREELLQSGEHQLKHKLEQDCLSVFVENALPILRAIGPGLSCDTILFTKLIRISTTFMHMKSLSTTSGSVATSSTVNGLNEQPMRDSSPAPSQTIAEQNQTEQQQQQQQQVILANISQTLLNLAPSELNFYNQIYTLLNEVLLPSLSMLSMNPCLAIELWNLLKMFSYEMRYYLYNNWRQNTYKHFPALIRTKAECQEKIKYLLK
jgi:hypothetical protein